MKAFKNFIIVSFVLLVGIYIGLYIYRHKEIKADSINNSSLIYLIQYGVYNTYESMKINGENISDYFYYIDDDGYHLIIGITENKNLSDKIKNAYNINTDVFLKEKNINNNEFIETLRQYDKLVEELNSSLGIINAEKQILSKYEELIIKYE